jgi:hypothetical protein
MKLVRRVSVIACALLLSTLALAKDKHEGKMNLTEVAKIGSTQLQPGHYKLEWQPEQGNSVRLEVLQHGKTVVTTQAKLKDLPQPSPYDSVAMKRTSQNQQKIEEVDFSNRKEALILGS